MAQNKLKPGFYYDGDRIVDANGKVVTLEQATEEPENKELSFEPTDLLEESEVEELVASYLSGTFGIERSSEETPEQFIGRVGRGYNHAQRDLESQANTFNASWMEAQNDITRLSDDLAAKGNVEAERDQFKGQLQQANDALATANDKVKSQATEIEKLKKELEKAKKTTT